MSGPIRVKWQADDGYISGERPQHLTVNPNDFDPSQTDEGIANEIREMIEDDFQQRVSATYADEDIAQAVAKIRAAIGTEEG